MIKTLFQTLYDFAIRPYLPGKIVVHNGVAVRSGKLLDATDVKPHYEESLIAAMRDRIDPGDEVVIVGGGRGVSTVIAQRCAGLSGSVTVFEGAAVQVTQIKETLELNQAAAGTTVNHAIVGDPTELWNDSEDAERVPPESLPDCDILVLDCEGSEVSILEDATLPEIVIVETHGIFDAPTDETRAILRSRGMTIENDRIEIEDEDVHVLTAVS
ncbi:FkbM family methyltransferase [Halobacterium noricense]|uniref:FkbM family methyltransferase n=1 Tax=Halobacterium noricense TaxID=223182 RepID=UPI001E4C4881|nr:FkbM family methyltransferase [Halobacterium noricense]UHH26534.1 FkbM family methyltransferase [Halobacterium noricense]